MHGLCYDFSMTQNSYSLASVHSNFFSWYLLSILQATTLCFSCLTRPPSSVLCAPSDHTLLGAARSIDVVILLRPGKEQGTIVLSCDLLPLEHSFVLHATCYYYYL
uniref:Uncharacterized protein n=1 Tax=Aegilops tauschii subsp. strangulata TaxID=200361 RepID=A0A453EPJ3_AEGTS